MVASGTDSVYLLFCEGYTRFMSLQERLSCIPGPVGHTAEWWPFAPSELTTLPSYFLEVCTLATASLYLRFLTCKRRKNFFHVWGLSLFSSVLVPMQKRIEMQRYSSEAEWKVYLNTPKEEQARVNREKGRLLTVRLFLWGFWKGKEILKDVKWNFEAYIHPDLGADWNTESLFGKNIPGDSSCKDAD